MEPLADGGLDGVCRLVACYGRNIAIEMTHAGCVIGNLCRRTFDRSDVSLGNE
jgi:hypothetical protein